MAKLSALDAKTSFTDTYHARSSSHVDSSPTLTEKGSSTLPGSTSWDSDSESGSNSEGEDDDKNNDDSSIFHTGSESTASSIDNSNIDQVVVVPKSFRRIIVSDDEDEDDEDGDMDRPDNKERNGEDSTRTLSTITANSRTANSTTTTSTSTTTTVPPTPVITTETAGSAQLRLEIPKKTKKNHTELSKQPISKPLIMHSSDSTLLPQSAQSLQTPRPKIQPKMSIPPSSITEPPTGSTTSDRSHKYTKPWKKLPSPEFQSQSRNTITRTPANHKFSVGTGVPILNFQSSKSIGPSYGDEKEDISQILKNLSIATGSSRKKNAHNDSKSQLNPKLDSSNFISSSSSSSSSISSSRQVPLSKSTSSKSDKPELSISAGDVVDTAKVAQTPASRVSSVPHPSFNSSGSIVSDSNISSRTISSTDDTTSTGSKSSDDVTTTAASSSINPAGSGKPLSSDASKISSNSGDSSSFFNRLQLAHQKQSKQRIFPNKPLPTTNSTSTRSSAAPSLSSTFDSPVRNFKSSTAALMEPLTPKSSQWSRPIDIEAAKSRKPVPFGSPMKPKSSDNDDEQDDGNEPVTAEFFRRQSKWGMKGAGNFTSSGQSTVLAQEGNSFAYMDPSKTQAAVKDLLSNLEQNGDDAHDNEEDKEVPGLEVTLLPHQVRGLKFLRKRENHKQKGGLLCDDMGLGKTIQSIALILVNPFAGSNSDISAATATACDAPAIPSVKTTLVIAPLALAEQWAEEIRTKAPSLRVLVHHGPNRTKQGGTFDTLDVVVTTYNIVSSEHQSNGALFAVNWWRIIIDEAHSIKNSKAKSSLAVCDLNGESRWCLTGTPIQNNVDELYSLFKFLRISPYNDQAVWRAQISRVISSGQGKVAMKRLHVVLGAVMLRRTKAILGQSGINLPQRRKHLVKLDFEVHEREFYDKLFNRVGNTIKALMDEDGRSKYMSALLLLLRLRQVCDDIRLANGKIDSDDKESCLSAATSSENRNDTDELTAMLGGLDIANDADPYLMKLGLSEDQLEQKKRGTTTVASTKVKEIINILQASPNRKTIVFSQFTSMLDLVEPSFFAAKIKFVRYDGSMSKSARETSLRHLKEDPSTQVLLCSLKCGAYGLNLTCASQVILVDPWWNPMVSEQAIDRVHRLGQKDDVDVYELIITGTVEEKILQLQNAKRELAKGVIESGKLATGANKLDLNELFALFT